MYSLPIYDFESVDEDGNSPVVKTLKRAFCPTSVFIDFETAQEAIEKSEDKSSENGLDILKMPFMRLFPSLTEEEFKGGTVFGDVMGVFADVVGKAASMRSLNNEKNV